ncbi:MAG: BamA/TamA family outer membrane protein, partial [Deltaproteobacteria bacterium]|nr:BamA/TamA family outer membrane protein [Deltaproteobacteria bacterium]
VFSWRTTATYGKSNTEEPFPLFKRYFPGGINSVRGYENRKLGPYDSEGHRYGGSKEFINNLEIIFPLLSSAGLKGVTFYDMGQAFDDDQSIDLGQLKKSWGYGIRWTSPLGPIRIEFGYPLDTEEGESKGMVTMFSFGAPM